MTDAPPPGPGGFCPMCSYALADHEPGELARCQREAEQTASELYGLPPEPAPFAGVGPTGPSAAESFARGGTPEDAARAIREQQHPAPWRWTLAVNDDGFTDAVLWDGDESGLTGEPIIQAKGTPPARVRALTAAAPEMEALLRQRLGEGDVPPAPEWVDAVDTLLARLDEAAKGDG